MNLQETMYWLGGLFPAELQLARHEGFHVAVAQLGSEFLCATADFGRVDQQLVTDGEPYTGTAEQLDVRTELFAVASNRYPMLEQAVVATATALADAHVAAEPGLLVRDIGDWPGLTVKHALLIPPYVWTAGVPQMVEKAGEVNADLLTNEDFLATRNLGRLTLLLQIVLLTDEEADYASTYGVGELQEQLVKQGADLLDLARGYNE